MKKLLTLIFFSFILGGCTLKFPSSKTPAGLEINSTPSAIVFLNGEEKGTTPFVDKKLNPGDYQLKLVPQSTSNNLPDWETRLTLKNELTTIVNKTFAESETDSSSYILELRQEPGDETFLSIISDPDTVNISIDGNPNGYTPITKLKTNPGSHSIKLTSPGYKSLDLSVNVITGYNLVINAKLASDAIQLTPQTTDSSTSPTASNSATSLPTSPSPPYVVIQETGTGWLRVRQEPSSSGDELGKVNVGETLPYLGKTSDTGWHQVKFEGQDGWLSAKYAKLVK